LVRALGLTPDWTPVHLGWREGAPVVDWRYTAGIAFDDPFFTESVERCLADPFRLLFHHETGIDAVGRFADRHPGLPPAGFVFHLSRCGSTLVAQMLAAAPQHLVISEASPIDAAIRSGRTEWLQWLVAALGQRRDARQRRMFVKFDSWSVLGLHLVRTAFPTVPWLFVYRDPVEVLVSHHRRRGAHLIPGALSPALFGLDGTQARELGWADYGARVLAAIAEAALAAAVDDPLATFVNYNQLPSFVLADLPSRWSLPLDRADSDRMAAAARRDAKNPALAFEDDGAAKHREATPEIETAVERHLAPVYRRLEQCRVAPANCR